jgi:hypothetical protein
VILEVSGITTATDGTPGVLNGSGSGAIGPPTYSTTAASEFLIYVYGDDGFGNSVTAPAGYTVFDSLGNTANPFGGSGLSDAVTGYKNSTGGAETGQWTLSGMQDWALIMVAFQLTGGGGVAVPAPVQQFRTAPRRNPARAVWGGVRGAAFVAVAAPVQLPRFPRRRPGRAVVQFSPVRTVNAAAVTAPSALRQAPYLPPRLHPARVSWRGSRPFTGFAAVAAPQQSHAVPPRLRPARVLWRGSRPFTGFAAVAAPHQPPYLPPRRLAARVLWHGSAPFTGFAAVAAPHQRPYLPARLRPARACVRFTPVATVNAAPVTPVAGTVPVLMSSPASTSVRRTSRISRF